MLVSGFVTDSNVDLLAHFTVWFPIQNYALPRGRMFGSHLVKFLTSWVIYFYPDSGNGKGNLLGTKIRGNIFSLKFHCLARLLIKFSSLGLNGPRYSSLV